MTSRQDELAAWLGGKRLEEQVANGSGTITSTIYGTAVGDSSNGSVEVVFTGDVVNYEDPDGVVHGTNTVELPTEIDVREGDEVRIVAVGPDGFKHLAVAGVLGGGDRTQEAIDAAQEAATEAQEAIDAQEQICWKDTNGVHVAEDQEQTGANFLANSLGVILRLGQNILSAMTASAFTIYDGLGNLASNIVATFGATSVIGRTGEVQMVFENDGIEITDPNDTAVFDVAYGTNLPDDEYYRSGTYMTLGTRTAGSDNGLYSVAIGELNEASQGRSMAIGSSNEVSGNRSFAFGTLNEVEAGGSFAFGASNTIPASTQHITNVAMGSNNSASDGACAIGYDLIAQGPYQVVVGKHNAASNDAFVVGGGAAGARANLFWVDPQGNAYASDGKLATAGTTLWSSTSGSSLSTAVNLSDSIASYKFIEVVYAIYGSAIRHTQRAAVYHSNNAHGAWVRLLTVSSIASNQIVLFTGTINASGSSASSSDVNTVTLKTTPSVAIASSSNLRVYEIIGYK